MPHARGPAERSNRFRLHDEWLCETAEPPGFEGPEVAGERRPHQPPLNASVYTPALALRRRAEGARNCLRCPQHTNLKLPPPMTRKCGTTHSAPRFWCARGHQWEAVFSELASAAHWDMDCVSPCETTSTRRGTLCATRSATACRVQPIGRLYLGQVKLGSFGNSSTSP